MSKPVIRIATAGVAVGLAVMIISVCVVLGFKHTIRDKVVGFGSHIQVADYLTLQSSEQFLYLANGRYKAYTVERLYDDRSEAYRRCEARTEICLQTRYS